MTASQGVATFSGLTLTKAASGYTLQVSSSGLSGATSSAITVATKASVITQVALHAAAGPATDLYLAPSRVRQSRFPGQPGDSRSALDTIRPGLKLGGASERRARAWPLFWG